MFGRDGKPLKSILKRSKVGADVISVQPPDGTSNTSAPKEVTPFPTMEGVNMHGSGLVVNIKEGNGGIAGKSCMDRTQMRVDGVSKTQLKNVTKEGSSKAAGISFASMFHPKSVSEDALVLTKRINFRTLVSEEQVSNHDTVLPKAAKESVMSRYANTLIGYFVGKSLAFQIVQNYVNNTWAKFGLSKLMKMDNGVFLFKFEMKSDMDQVIEQGSWLIRNTPLILSKWAPNVSLKPGEVTKVPIWVKLYNVPVVAYSEDGLSLIATQVGKLIMLDAFTSSMCVTHGVG
ncbi:putative reverse transcriptase domain, ribonuclease H-like domain, aspartic peptidase domain protein [Tanacetum coccineum]